MLRLYSTLLCVLTVVCVYATAKDLFPSTAWLQAAAAGVTALNPQFIFITAAISNDAGAALAGAACLLFVVRAARTRAGRPTDALLGLSLGAAALTKLSLLIAIPFAAVVLAVVGLRRRDSLAVLAARAILIAGIALAVAGWWYARNLSLYGDATGFNLFLRSVGGTDQGTTTMSEYASDLPGLFKSFWSLFGWFSIEIGSSAYAFYGLLCLASLVGIAYWLASARRSFSKPVGAYRASGPWMTLVLAALVQYRTMVLAFQGQTALPGRSARLRS